MLSNAYREGIAFALKYGVYKNPYRIGSDEYNDLERGWSQANKKYPQAVERADRKTNELKKHARKLEEKSHVSSSYPREK